MAKPKRKPKRKHQHQPGPSMQDPAARLEELDRLTAGIVEAGGGDGPTWGQVHKLLLKTDADSADVGGIIARRDVEALQRCVDQLLGRASAAQPEVAETTGPEIDDETLKKAMRAFRKRLKLTKLDHESKLGVGPMTGGKKAEIDGIIAPREFDDAVWEALVAAGRLKPMGRGFYALRDET